MNSLWITDPWDSLDHPNDTTLRLMEASSQLGHSVAWACSRSLRWSEGKVHADVGVFRPKDRSLSVLRTRRPTSPPLRDMKLHEFAHIHYRVDPPIDLAYLQPLQMLAQAHPRAILNPASSLVLLSEKTIAQDLPEMSPRSLVSSDPSLLKAFIQREEVVILKPLHSAQSRGIEKLSADDSPEWIHSHLKNATEEFKRPILLQEYLPEIMKSGETRLWFAGAQLVATAQKIPARGDFKIDMDQGSRLEKSKISQQLKPRIEKISKWLSRHKIQLAAVDWIEGKITDFNITSPGLIVGMEKVLKQDLAKKIIRHLQ